MKVARCRLKVWKGSFEGDEVPFEGGDAPLEGGEVPFEGVEGFL